MPYEDPIVIANVINKHFIKRREGIYTYPELVQCGYVGLYNAYALHGPDCPDIHKWNHVRYEIKKFISKEAEWDSMVIRQDIDARFGNGHLLPGMLKQEKYTKLIESLEEMADSRDRYVLKSVYMNEKPATEVALKLNVSTQRVSELKKRALTRLRKAYVEINYEN